MHFQRTDKISYFNWDFHYIKCLIAHFQAQLCHRVNSDLCCNNSKSRKSVIMKSFVAGLVLALSLGLVIAAPSQTAIEIKEDQAIQECNATNPVHRNPRIVTGAGIATGDRIKLSQEEKCFLFCFLKKVKFVNENADINNGAGLVNFTLRTIPELAKYSDVIIATVFQINRSTKGFDDKCQKAFVAYHQYSQNLFVLAIAQGLQETTGVKDKIVNSLESGQSVDQELSQQVKQFLGFFDVLITSYGKAAENHAQAQPQQRVAV